MQYKIHSCRELRVEYDEIQCIYSTFDIRLQIVVWIYPMRAKSESNLPAKAIHDSLILMSTISTVMPYIQVAISALLIIAILLQHTGAQNGGALGGSDTTGSVFHTRRGLEKLLFIATIVLGVLFAVTSFLSLVR